MNACFTSPAMTGRAALGIGILMAALAWPHTSAQAAGTDMRQDRAELRISSMHSKLAITAAQESQWAKVATAMRDDAKTMDTLTQARLDQAAAMNAVDDLKSYEELAAAHADGVKRLAEAFGPLYADMSATQKTQADALFRKGASHPMHHRMPTKEGAP